MDLAVYTTIHPGTLPFLDEWYASLNAQTDTDFALWIGIDEVRVEQACSEMGAHPDDANWVQADPEDTPAQVRERTWRILVPEVDAVVMVDADDVMHSDRINSARRQIRQHDGVGCALRMVGEDRRDLGYIMPPERSASVEKAFPRYNIFGLSNTAYRTGVLEQCLSVPNDVVLIDWYIAMLAWLRGDDLAFDRTVRMKYRQHRSNTLSVLPPFTPKGVEEATEVVQNHFQAVEQNVPSDALEDRWEATKREAQRVNDFADHIADPESLHRYTQKVNQLSPIPLWWACVAHPNLESLWKNKTSE
jgi:hypothetical protein